jgi:hypothetical protein
MHSTHKMTVAATGLAAALLGCEGAGKGPYDLTDMLGGDGKSDMLKSARIIDDVGPDSRIQGAFDRKVRVYGYVVEARRGAELNVSLRATPGEDAFRGDPDAELDTLLAVHGPYVGPRDPGALLAFSDDGETLAAPDVDFRIQRDGRYLILFSSWEDTGNGGAYELAVSCAGTDFQCRRPAFERPCSDGQLFLQGGSIDEDTTWDVCEVVLLEPTVVAEDAILTVRPGVEVKGNYLGSGTFGNVVLDVRGTLQAAGTSEHPINFTSFVADRGWGGIRLGSPSNTLSHVYIDRAQVAVDIAQGAGGRIADAVIQGIDPENLQGIGVRTGADVTAHFERAVVKEFSTGLHLVNAQRLEVEDSVIRDNRDGVLVDGTGHTTSCGNPPATPVFRDPRFVHTDIVDNQRHGILVRGHDVLVQVEKSNIVGNGGPGFELRGRGMHPESFIRTTNLHGNNNGGRQVISFHRSGTLDLSGNYWVHISDPELGQSFQMSCTGEFTFTGFAPVEIADAGPRLERLSDPVKDQTHQQRQ